MSDKKSQLLPFAGAVLFLSAAGLSIATGQCYVPKTPTGCGDCGTSSMTYCEYGCESGSPGMTGPGFSATFYCSSYDEGESQSWPCDDPDQPIPNGWSPTACAPSGGMCCIVHNWSSRTFNFQGNDSCLHGHSCDESQT